MKAFGTARLGGDMELRYMPDGSPVSQVSLAFRLGIKDKSTGEYKTQWISASMFGKRAETLTPMLTKGSLHAFHLRDIHIDEFTGTDGEVRHSLKAIIDDVELCGKSDGNHTQTEKPKGDARPEKPPVQSGSFDDFDQNIPFLAGTP